MRLLLVEDDHHLNRQLTEQLNRQQYAVDCAFDGKEGLYLGSEIDFDIAIIDLGLPELDGISLIKELRARQKNFPILILTARNRWQEKVAGLDAGADDYLVKPFQMEELQARLKALVRRFSGWSSPLMEFAPLSINTSSQEVRLNDKRIELTAFEYKTLQYLAMHAGKVISKTELTEHLYAQDYDRDSNVVEVFIRRLRKKLDADKQIRPIQTIRGSGYCFNLKSSSDTKA